MSESELGKELLFRMKRIRHIEETISTRYSEGKMRCPVHLSTGQEAVAAAVGLALRPDDYAVSGHRAHAHYLGKGGDLKKMLAEIYGKRTGCCGGKGGSMHLIDRSVGFTGSTAIVAGTIPVGVGLGYAIHVKKTQQVSCIFFGDGAVEEGVFYEAANFAVLKKLPVLFICENNLYSVYSPIKVRQPAYRKIHEMTKAMGLSSALCDGNNVEEIAHITETSLKSIRAGEGPGFLEFATYRWREHCGPNFDNEIGYRTESEFLQWKARDPIGALEKKLNLTFRELEIMNAVIHDEVEEAFRFAEDSPFPDAHEAYCHLFSEVSKLPEETAVHKTSIVRPCSEQFLGIL